MKSKIRVLLYLLAACFFFVFWMFWVFPYSTLESRILTEIENNFHGRYKIEATDTDLSLFGSLAFKNLSVKESSAEGSSQFFKTPKLKLDFSPIAFLSKKIDVDFYFEGQGKGEVEGAFAQKTGERTNFEIDFDAYPMADLKGLWMKANLAFRGELDGAANLEFYSNETQKNQGEIDLALVNLSLDPTSMDLNLAGLASVPLNIPRIKLSGAKGSHIQAQLKGKQVEFSAIHLQDGDLGLDLKGTLNVSARNMRDYRLSLEGSFKISDKLLNNIKAQQAKDVAENIDGILILLNQQKTSEGVYPISIEGRLSGKPEVKIGKFRLPI